MPSAHRDAAAFILPALVMCAVDASALAWPELPLPMDFVDADSAKWRAYAHC